MKPCCPHCDVELRDGVCGLCGYELPTGDMAEALLLRGRDESSDDGEEDGIWRFLVVWIVIVVGATILLMRACAP